MRIVVFHLYNDYSGSPKVLRQVLQEMLLDAHEVHLFTSKDSEGFLSGLHGVAYHFFPYRFFASTFMRLFTFAKSQFVLFFKLLFFLQKNDVVYINTVLPFGAALAGKIRGCKVIYHIHETSIRPLLLKKMLFAFVRFCATELVYVSKFLAQQDALPLPKTIIYNALDHEFISQASHYRSHATHHKSVLMICSLKRYKGVDVFVQLAQRHPEYPFSLVVNASQEDIALYFKGQKLPENLSVFPTQTNTHPFYQKAGIIVNLSDPDVWVETFGLTILEGMTYGLPAIVPPVGGVTELVDNHENGFRIHPNELHSLSTAIQNLLTKPSLYTTFSDKAWVKSQSFSPELFGGQIRKLLSKK